MKTLSPDNRISFSSDLNILLSVQSNLKQVYLYCVVYHSLYSTMYIVKYIPLFVACVGIEGAGFRSNKEGAGLVGTGAGLVGAGTGLGRLPTAPSGCNTPTIEYELNTLKKKVG